MENKNSFSRRQFVAGAAVAAGGALLGQASHAESPRRVLSANLDCGDRVVLEAVGPDDQEALNELEALLLRFRDEEGGAQGNCGSSGTIEA